MATRLLWDRHPAFPDAKAPERAHPTDAGFDVFAAEDVIIGPGEVVKCRTGICVHPEPTGLPVQGQRHVLMTDGEYNAPGGWTLACLVWDKSGRGASGLKVMGGVIDAPYTGEVLVVLANVATASWFGILRSFLEDVVQNGLGLLGRMRLEFPSRVTVKKGEKLANLLVQRVELPELIGPAPLAATARGGGGFGSTGR